MRFFTFIALFFLSLFGNPQINNAQVNRGPCFQKAADRLGKRYVDWQCDERDSIVDCNEELSQTPGTNIVRLRSSGELFSGNCESCHDNGLKQRLVNFQNGKVNGLDTTYYRSGCPQVVRNHIAGVENGTWTYFNDTSGLIAWQINYSEGVKDGRSIYYSQKKVGENALKVLINGEEKKIPYNDYENDTLKIEIYKDGRLNGIKKEYYPNSKLEKEVSYKDGVFDGPFIVYDKEGNILQELNYKEGKKEGEWKYYYNDGNLLKIENWEEDVKNGVFKTFYIQGTIQTSENFKKGLKHGEFIERFPNDKLKRSAFYKKDELIEEHVFDEKGNEIKTVGGDGPKKNNEDDQVTQKKSKKWWQFWK